MSSINDPCLLQRDKRSRRAALQDPQGAFECRLRRRTDAMFQGRPDLGKGLSELARVVVVNKITCVLEGVRFWAPNASTRVIIPAKRLASAQPARTFPQQIQALRDSPDFAPFEPASVPRNRHHLKTQT